MNSTVCVLWKHLSVSPYGLLQLIRAYIRPGHGSIPFLVNAECMDGNTSFAGRDPQSYVSGRYGFESGEPFVANGLFSCGFGNRGPVPAIDRVVHRPACCPLTQPDHLLQHQHIECSGLTEIEGDGIGAIGIRGSIIGVFQSIDHIGWLIPRTAGM